ncbi:Major core protein 4b [uncultured virus]|nr:Major core protein 4b [uncultured virus]
MQQDTFRKNQRDTTGDDYESRQDQPKGKDADIMQEVKKLIKEGKSDYSVLLRLRNKYKDQDLVDEIFDAYKDRTKMITNKARKFKQLIINKYGPQNLPLEKLMLKAKKYQKKYGLSDDEFQVFTHMALTDKNLSPFTANLPHTPIAKMLGYEAAMTITDKLNIKENEYANLQEILKLFGETKPLHSQVVVQSLSYRDSAPEALTGTFEPSKHNVYSYVHPIIAALFIPRIGILEDHMLLANIGYIVKSKHDETPIMTKPDFDLYWSLIMDPNESVCSKDSPLIDLRNRFILQTKLWDSVLNLRQGKYYNERLNDFLMAIDNCRNNIYDAPDLTYVKDEGSILRRILSAFSLRPTIVSTTRLYNVMGGTTYGFSLDPFTAAGVTQVTSVPIVTLRLPLSLGNQTTAISLEQALSQPQWFVENKTLVPKAQSIMHSRDVLFFYIGRRFQNINITRLQNPCNFASLPMTVAGWESLNDRIVNFQMRMTILNDSYQLRSVVLIESSPNRRNLIIGSSAAIVIPMSIQQGRFEETFLLYDPQGAGEMFKVGNAFTRNPPITYIPGNTPFNNDGSPESFYSRASKKGTIFMYQKVTDGVNVLCP